MNISKGQIVAGIVAVLVVVGLLVFGPHGENTPIVQVSDYKNIAYIIDGQSIKLIDGHYEMEAVSGSASKIVTQYFGNDFKTDLDGDGIEDIVFLVTQDRGGSGSFYYVVAAIKTTDGYVGSDGYLLGDRIAPQNIVVSQNPTHKNVIVVNYADRAEGEPMTMAPSVGKSAYLKLNPETMQWGVVAADFEGESNEY